MTTNIVFPYPANQGDMYTASNGVAYTYDGTKWVATGGVNGATGATGATGADGATGASGASGPSYTGATGADGSTGATGNDGATGATGSTGPDGATGSTGPQGDLGATGPQGATGADSTVPGATGATGVPGATGTSVTIIGSVPDVGGDPQATLNAAYPGAANGDGVIDQNTGDLWVFANGTWTDVGTIKGPTGSTGATGADGATGATGETGATGADSTVPGATGSTGPDGATGATGGDGATGASGLDGATGASGIDGATGATGVFSGQLTQNLDGEGYSIGNVSSIGTGSGTNNVVIQPDAGTAGYTLTLPIDTGSNTQVLTTDGTGILSWTTPTGGSGSVSIVPNDVTYIANGNLYGNANPGFTVVTGNDDDEAYSIPVDFPIEFLGNSYSAGNVWLVSNSYLTFGPTSYTDYRPVGPIVVPVPAIYLGTLDLSNQKYYYGYASGTDVFVIGYEGSIQTSGTPGYPAMRWELQVSATTPDQIQIVVNGANDNGGSLNFPGGIWGISDGAEWVDQFQPLPWFSNNNDTTYNTILIAPVTPVSANLIAFTGPGVTYGTNGNTTYINIDPFDEAITVAYNDDIGESIISSTYRDLTLSTARQGEDLNLRPLGAVNINGASASDNQPGPGYGVYIYGGNAHDDPLNPGTNNNGGQVDIYGGSGVNAGTAGNVNIHSGGNTWTFDPAGKLRLPNANVSETISTQGGYITIGNLLVGAGGSLFNTNNDIWALYGNISDPDATITIPSNLAAANGTPLSLQVSSNVDIISGGGTWSFGNDGSTVFPTLTTQRGDNPSGTISGQTLLFGDATQEAIISTPDGSNALGINSQRLVINPGAGAPGTSGEGGDIYLWAGRGGDVDGNGGDVKIRGGQGMGNGPGGYIRMEAGDTQGNGDPGYIEITGGQGGNTSGGYVNVTGGYGATVGGDVKIYGGYGQATGGNVNIWGGASGNGQANEGHVNIETGGNTWTFAADGNLTLPSNTANINYANGVSILDGIGGGGNANIGNFVFDSYSLDGTAFDEITLGGTNSGNILINTPGLVTVIGGYESDGMVAGNGNVYVFNNDPTFVDGIPQPGVGYTWQFDNNGNLIVPGPINGLTNATVSLNAFDNGGNPSVQILNWDVANTAPSTLISVDPSVFAVVTNITGKAGGTVKEWDFHDDGNLNLPQGGWIGAAGVKGDGTMLTGGKGNIASLTSFYSNVDALNYSSCVTVNADGTLNITTYGDGTGQLGQWNFANTTLNVPGNGTISTANAVSGQGGDAVTIQGGASDAVTWNSNPGGNVNIVGGYGSFGDGGGGPGGQVRIIGGGSSDSHPGNIVISSNENPYIFDYTGNLTLPGNTFSVNYANGTPVSLGGGSGNTGNVTFSDQIVIGTGDQYGYSGLYLAPGANSISGNTQYFRVRGGDVPNHLHFDTGDNTYYDQYFGDDNKYVKLANAGNIIINSNDYAGNTAQWTFDTLGNVSLPGNTTIMPGYPGVGPAANTFSIVNDGQAWITNTAGNTYVGYDVANGAAIAANGNEWLFANNGTLTTPGTSGNISGANVISANTFAIAGGTILSQVEGANTVGFYNANASTQFLIELGPNSTWDFDGSTGALNLPVIPAGPGSNGGFIQTHNAYPTLLAYGSSGHGGPEMDWCNSDDVGNIFGNSSVIRHTLFLNDEDGLFVGFNENGVANTYVGNFQVTTDGNVVVPTQNKSGSQGESAVFRGTRRIVGGINADTSYSATLSAGGTPSVAYTASSSTVNSVKITFAVQSSGGGFQWEQFDVVAVLSQDVGGAVNFVVSNRVKGAASIGDTQVTATINGSNLIEISLNLDAAQTSGGTASFDAVEFGLMVD